MGHASSLTIGPDRSSAKARRPDGGCGGSKLHLVCEGSGLPLTAAVTAANVPDVTMLQAMVDEIPPVRTPSGRRRTRPGKLDADKGYDSAANRAWLRRRGIRARIARRGIDGANLLGAILKDAQFQEANLASANLQGATLEAAQLQKAQADPKTIWPADFDPNAAGVVLLDRRADAKNRPES